MAAHVYRSWMLLINMVGERGCEHGRYGVAGKENAALVLLELAEHITTHHKEAFLECEQCCGLV